MSIIFFISITLFGRVNAQNPPCLDPVSGFSVVFNSSNCTLTCTPTGIGPTGIGSFIVTPSLPTLVLGNQNSQYAAQYTVTAPGTYNEIYEANERDVNNVIFDILINQQATFDENQENPLIHIALQCPEDGGWAVFEARAILAQKYDYQYNFDDICGSKPIGTKVQKNHVFNTLTVAPNPIKEEFTVFIAKDDDSHYDKIEIVDMYGRSVYSAVIGEKEKTIRINSAAFANGSYQCVLFGGSTILARQKLFKINQ